MGLEKPSNHYCFTHVMLWELKWLEYFIDILVRSTRMKKELLSNVVSGLLVTRRRVPVWLSQFHPYIECPRSLVPGAGIPVAVASFSPHTVPA